MAIKNEAHLNHAYTVNDGKSDIVFKVIQRYPYDSDKNICGTVEGMLSIVSKEQNISYMFWDDYTTCKEHIDYLLSLACEDLAARIAKPEIFNVHDSVEQTITRLDEQNDGLFNKRTLDKIKHDIEKAETDWGYILPIHFYKKVQEILLKQGDKKFIDHRPEFIKILQSIPVICMDRPPLAIHVAELFTEQVKPLIRRDFA